MSWKESKVGLTELTKDVGPKRTPELGSIKVRFAVIGFFLLMAVVFLPLFSLRSILTPVLLVCSIGIISNCLSLIWIAWGKGLRYRIYFATFMDVLLITAAIHYLGGIENSFSWVYVIVLIVIALRNGLKIGIYVATVSSLMYSALLIAEFTEVIPHLDYGIVDPIYVHENPFYLKIRLLSGTILFFFTAVVTGVLSGRLLRSKNELERTVALRTEALTTANERLREDIIERKQTEKALQESEKRYRLLADNVKDLIWTLDTESLRFTYVSPSVLDMRGYTVEEAMQQPLKEVMTPASLAVAMEALAGELAPENVEQKGPVWSRTIELEQTRKDGSTHWVEVSVTFVRDEQGRPVELLGVSRDITDRKQAEKALQDSEEKYRLLVENSVDGIFILQDGVTKFSSPIGLEMFGHTAEELAKIPFLNLIHPDERDIAMEIYRKRLRGEDVPSGHTFRMMTKSGKTFWGQVNSILTEWKGKPAVFCFVRDMTTQKRLEIQLQRAQKMEAIGTLAGGVAHDLNNILSGIVGYPELLLLDLPEDSHLRKPLQTIQESGQKAATIVQDMLTLARSGVAVSEVVNLNDVINNYLQSPECQKLKSFHPDVQIRTELENDLLNILASPVHISKTVMNLVSNAAEAMPAGGEIHISTANRYLDRPVKGYDNVTEGDYVILAVSDTGVGLSPEDMERIFEPFYTKKVMGRSGTGLGTAVVWATVKDYKGYVDVHSDEGKGTTFTLYFPVTRRVVSDGKSDISVGDYMGAGESVLVVDDMAEQREVASGMLERLGYSVISVASGEKAVEYMSDNSADLLLLDMIMDPGIGGLETYKRIVRLHPGQKAIIASGFSETAHVKEAQELGAGAYIRKPYTLEKIGVAIRSELNKQ